MSEAGGPVPDLVGPAPEPAVYDVNKRPADIEADIARTRTEISETLDALERKLAPRQLLEKGVDMLRDSMDGNFGKVGETLRANPIPLALIAGGLGWFLLSRSGGARAVGDVARSSGDALGTAARRVGDVASDAAHRVKEMIGGETPADPNRDDYAYARTKPSQGFETPGERTAAGAAGTVSDVARKAHEAFDAAGERASAYAGSLGENLDRARSRISQLMDEHPMAIGVFGFLAGAALAVALPSTRLGNATLGPARDRLLDEAKERGREVVERVRRTAEAVADAASAEAEKAEAQEEAEPAQEASVPGGAS